MPVMTRTICAVLLLSATFAAASEPLATFTVKDHLNHQWSDELVHFRFAVPGDSPLELTLTDAEGAPLPTQLSEVARHDGQLVGKAWTVVSLAPRQTLTLHLRPGASPESQLRLESHQETLVLRNDRVAVRLPRLTLAPDQVADLAALPAPLLGISHRSAATWFGSGRWTNAAAALQVKQAQTTVVEEGPVRITVRYRLTLSDDRFYQAEVTLGAQQDMVLFRDETDIDAADAAFVFSLQSGLEPDHLYWRDNHYTRFDSNLKPQPIDAGKEQVLCRLCPWTFWWQEGRSMYAGFFKEGEPTMVSVMAMRPSRWSPGRWDGFDRSVVPVTARAEGQVDLTLPLLATTDKHRSGPGPARRELGFTVGRVEDVVTDDRHQVKLRRQMVKYSEFPLDHVKDFAFDFKRSHPDRTRPFLLFTQEDVDRARRQAETVPMMKGNFDAAIAYLSRLNIDHLVGKIRKADGWRQFFHENYVHNGLYDVVPQAYLGSDDPRYGLMLASGVKGIAELILDQFLRKPGRSSLASNGHMSGTNPLRLLLAYDAIADTGLLTEQEKADVESVFVLLGYVFDHPDYWNPEHGLGSANPNMTSLLRLPLGLIGLYLDGHPQADHWLECAEKELQYELTDDWIAPGGAWLECPMYQTPSLDGMFLLATAIRNVRGKDYFADPNFQATMNFAGFILTAPDLRFPTLSNKLYDITAPMTTLSVGDAFPCFTHPFNGWMAQATAQSDPQFSAVQQFYWRGQSFSTLNGGRAGFIPAMCDPELPAATPAELARAFPGYGNIMRTSWDDPNAGYVSHRCGYFSHHFDPGDGNSIIYYAKGAPLCVDFGHRSATAEQVRTMWMPMYHSTVTFDRERPHGYWGASGGPRELSVQSQQVRSLPSTVDYSTGITMASGGQRHYRHLLLIKSHDSMGATYLVVRDLTHDNQRQQSYTWSLWCMSEDVQISGNVAHFPGQFAVDLDAHVLAPANPQLTKNHYEYEQWVNPWGKFHEKQHAIHVPKQGSTEDFFAVLFPRASGQPAAEVKSLADARAAAVNHFEGRDLLLLSPAQDGEAADGDLQVSGRIAFARWYRDGAIRLALVLGSARAACGPWSLASDKPVAVQISDGQISGESSGDGGDVTLTLPPTLGQADLSIDGAPAAAKRDGSALTFTLPEGDRRFTITGR